MGNSASSNLPALQSVASCETAKMMGTWFVIAVKPTMFEKENSNAVEKYSFLKEKGGNDIDIDFTYNAKEDPFNSPLKSAPQKGWVQGPNKENSGTWKVSPFWPVKVPYQIIEVDTADYKWVVIGYPSRSYAWIMARQPVMDADLYKTLTTKLVKNHQYTLDGLRKVPQRWTAEERQKRGLTKDEIPDALLEK